MSYIVFARKYRPRNFDEITGQFHITTTLKNAIEQSRVAHAYLFAGPRGVGKTTTARILAKALNCEKGPTAKPCDKCVSCKEISSGSSLDIFEIDGASNNGINEIRSLRENAKFTPAKSKFKVYIIDEVHMLSTEAFNALLKTLEEPPPHVKFIFATTHAHKVPPTILSRCQRFDFRRIPSVEILKNLKDIVKEEKLHVSDEALGLIVRYSDGSMRDAQVVLDQITSFTKGKVGVEDVAKVLGVVDDEILFKLSDAMHNKDPKSALKIVEALVNDGKDIIQTVQGLIEHFRNISVAKVSTQPGPLIDAGKEKVARYVEEAAKFTIEEMLYIIYTLSNTIDFMRKTDMARIPLETALVKLTLNAGIVPMADLLKRVEALEGREHISEPVLSKAGVRPIVNKRSDEDEPPPVEDPTPDDSPAAAKTVSPQRSGSLEDILSGWSKVISAIRARKISIASYLQEGDPMRLEGNALTIGFAKEYQFHKEVLESNENRKIIETAISEMLGLNLRVSLIVTSAPSSGARASSHKLNNLAGTDAGDEVAGQVVSDDSDPIVKRALEMFGGKLAVGGNGKGKA